MVFKSCSNAPAWAIQRKDRTVNYSLFFTSPKPAYMCLRGGRHFLLSPFLVQTSSLKTDFSFLPTCFPLTDVLAVRDYFQAQIWWVNECLRHQDGDLLKTNCSAHVQHHEGTCHRVHRCPSLIDFFFFLDNNGTLSYVRAWPFRPFSWNLLTKRKI